MLIAGAIIVGVAIVAVFTLTGDDPPDSVSQIAPTPTLQPEAGAGAIVSQFVEALRTKDADALYAIQEDAYKRVCDRAAFQAVADSLETSPLEGPASVVVTGNTAGASLIEVQSDGTRVPVVVPLLRQDDGQWRLAAPSYDGCRP